MRSAALTTSQPSAWGATSPAALAGQAFPCRSPHTSARQEGAAAALRREGRHREGRSEASACFAALEDLRRSHEADSVRDGNGTRGDRAWAPAAAAASSPYVERRRLSHASTSDQAVRTCVSAAYHNRAAASAAWSAEHSAPVHAQCAMCGANRPCTPRDIRSQPHLHAPMAPSSVPDHAVRIQAMPPATGADLSEPPCAATRGCNHSPLLQALRKLPPTLPSSAPEAAESYLHAKEDSRRQRRRRQRLPSASPPSRGPSAWNANTRSLRPAPLLRQPLALAVPRRVERRNTRTQSASPQHARDGAARGSESAVVAQLHNQIAGFRDIAAAALTLVRRLSQPAAAPTNALEHGPSVVTPPAAPAVMRLVPGSAVEEIELQEGAECVSTSDTLCAPEAGGVSAGHRGGWRPQELPAGSPAQSVPRQHSCRPSRRDRPAAERQTVHDDSLGDASSSRCARY